MSPILHIGQSADPDDAFMAWALPELLREMGLEAHIDFQDIETLNRRTIAGEFDLSAISVAAYPAIADRYRLLRSGASFGAGYGPVLVSRSPAAAVGALDGLRIAIPGRHTTAALLLRVHAGDSFEAVEVPFDAILGAVLAGTVDAGLVIHEGQLLYGEMGLHALFEPATSWASSEALPLPLGAVVVRRSLDADLQKTLAETFARSVHRAFTHREAALAFAARYARGLPRPALEQYVDRYVDAATLDMGDRGQRAIERLFELAVQRGLLDVAPRVDLI